MAAAEGISRGMAIIISYGKSTSAAAATTMTKSARAVRRGTSLYFIIKYIENLF